MSIARERRKTDVAIIGAGASGLAAAIELGMKAPHLDVTVIEKMGEAGKKLRATGSGRCNISNVSADGFNRIMDFFREIGLVTRIYDNGLVYPYSESASDVADLMTAKAASLGADFAYNEEVLSVKKDGSGFVIESVFKGPDVLNSIVTEASFVILAMGGKAGPSYGTIGDGYRIARNLGHSVVSPVPALSGIECAEWKDDALLSAKSIAGIRSAGVVSLYKKEESGEAELFEEPGEIQFTAYGLSGICIFNMTRLMRYDRKSGESIEDFSIRADLFPDGNIRDYIKDRAAGGFSEESAGGLLESILKKPLKEYVMERASGIVGRDLKSVRISDLDDSDVDAISEAVHRLRFKPAAVRGWKDAQVTMGGVSLEELNDETSESKLAGGLYITGELADRDFMCGGYNLSNAWITGLAAADDIAKCQDTD